MRRSARAVELKNAGDNYYRRGDLENALHFYGLAIKEDPEYREAWNNTYTILIKEDRIEEAKKCKEIMNELEDEPFVPQRKIWIQHSSFTQKVLIGLVVIVGIIVLTLLLITVFGSTGGRDLITAVENQFHALIP
jgi:tetratricopeptide (TPR) repeat protein